MSSYNSNILWYKETEDAFYLVVGSSDHVSDPKFTPSGPNRYRTTAVFSAVGYRQFATGKCLKKMAEFSGRYTYKLKEGLGVEADLKMRKDRDWEAYDKLHDFEKLLHRAREVSYYTGRMTYDPNQKGAVAKNAKLGKEHEAKPDYKK